MEALKLISVALLALITAGLVITAGLKAMGNLKESTCDGTYDATEAMCWTCPTTGNCSSGCSVNISSNTCYNGTSATETVTATVDTANAEFNASKDAVSGTTEISGQFPTIGIVVAMVVVLMLIGGLTAYFAFR